MRIAITSRGNDLDSPVDQRFGRCPILLIVETDDMTYDAIENPYVEEAGGVGGRLASLLADRHVSAVLTGAVGPHAQQALEAAGIQIVPGCSGSAREGVEAFKAGGFDTHQPTASAPPASGGGRGLGKGRGRGGGGGGQQRERRRLRQRGCGND
jgi:predicted Fe-Mo cluster-binding NifX family protein